MVGARQRARLSEIDYMCGSAHLQLGFCAVRAGHPFCRAYCRFHDEILLVLFSLLAACSVQWEACRWRGARKKGSLVEAMVRRFDSEPRLTLAIAPEGTRKRTANWHSGVSAHRRGCTCASGACHNRRPYQDHRTDHDVRPLGRYRCRHGADKEVLQPFPRP